MESPLSRMRMQWDHELLAQDRGRDEGVSLAPPSEPYGRFSRIRLSSWWFALIEVGRPRLGLSSD
jgi:hypothetical protein